VDSARVFNVIYHSEKHVTLGGGLKESLYAWQDEMFLVNFIQINRTKILFSIGYTVTVTGWCHTSRPMRWDHFCSIVPSPSEF